MIDDKTLAELSWQSYRDVHTPAAREQLMATHGDRWFKERGHYHTGILKAALKLLEEWGYTIVPPAAPKSEDGADLV